MPRFFVDPKEVHPSFMVLTGENAALDGKALLAEADQFPVGAGAGAFAAAETDDGLQQVGLTLGIVADNQIDTGIKIQFQLPVIAKIL